MRKPTTQKHPSGCGAACVAYALGIEYDATLRLFRNGFFKAKSRGFYLKEMLQVLEKAERYYVKKFINQKTKKLIYQEGSIVFLKRSGKYPEGHYLSRVKGKWMDPWINFPCMCPAKSGFRNRLPGKAIYAILPKRAKN